MNISNGEIERRMDAGDTRFKSIEDAISSGMVRFDNIEGHQREQAVQMQALTKAVCDLRHMLEPIAGEISTISQVALGWKTVGVVGKFVKWSSGILVALAAIAVSVKAWGAGILRGVS